jgi:hypothetical protein
MQLTPVIENFLEQCRQHENVVSVSISEPTQTHMTQIKRTDVIVFNFIIELDTTEHVPVNFVIPVSSITETSYVEFDQGLNELMSCDCVVTKPVHHDRIMRDINQSAFNNYGPATYFIRPEDGWMVSIYGEYADTITPTDPVFLELIEKIKNTEHVLDVNVEKLLDNSILTEEEKKFDQVFFRIKHTIPGTADFRYGHFIMSELSCCNVLEHTFALTQIQSMIEATPE